MKTDTQQFINKININALKSNQNQSNNLINQDGELYEKLFINVPFDGYHHAVTEVKTLANVIEVLSLHSCISEKESLELISSVSRMIQNIIPDLNFVDSLLFEDSESTNQNFKPTKEII